MQCQTYSCKTLFFSSFRGLKWDPPVTQEVKGRKQNHFGFWNISSRATSVASFIEIGQPKFPTSGTLSLTMTLKTLIKRYFFVILMFQYGAVTANLCKFGNLSRENELCLRVSCNRLPSERSLAHHSTQSFRFP